MVISSIFIKYPEFIDLSRQGQDKKTFYINTENAGADKLQAEMIIYEETRSAESPRRVVTKLNYQGTDIELPDKNRIDDLAKMPEAKKVYVVKQGTSTLVSVGRAGIAN